MRLKVVCIVLCLFGLVDALAARAQDGAAAPAPDMAMAASLTRMVEDTDAFRGRLGATIAALPDVPRALLAIHDRLAGEGEGRRLRLPILLAGLAGVLAAAAVAEGAFRRLFGPIVPRTDDGLRSPGDFGRLALLATAALVDALALAVFAVVAGMLFLAVQPDDDYARKAFWAVFLAILGVRGALILGRMILAPRRPALRLPPLDDGAARRLFRWIAAIATLVCGSAALVVLANAAGFPGALGAAIGMTLHWFLTLVLLVFVWRERRTIGQLVMTRPALARRSRAAEFLIRNAHVLIGILIVGLTLLSTVSRLLTGRSHVGETVATLALLAMLPLADGLMRLLVGQLVAPAGSSDTVPAPATRHSGASASGDASQRAAAAPGADDGARSAEFAPVIIRNLRIALGVLTLLLVDWIWRLDVHGMAAGSLGARIAGSLFDIIVTLIIASAVWGIVSTAVMRYAPRDGIDAQAQIEGEGGGTGLTRLQTLLPLFRKFLLVVLVVLVGMIIISSLGIDIGPLLAGAGVVGIALGFGAQALVRDIFSGIFFLIDDAFRVGEYIDVGQAKGTVERISIRSLRLRHHLGPIHTIPFGAIDNVTNFSRDWVIMKLELRLPADTDLERVRKLVKQLGQELMRDAEYGPQFLQPLKSQGVHRMDDDAFIVRVKFMARPGEQFVLRREVYRRLQELFRQHGIRFAPRRVIVDAAGAPAAAAAAAAVTSLGPGGAAGAAGGGADKAQH